MQSPITLKERPRVLIARLSSLGDVIHAMPVVCALRDRFPSAYLAWLVEYPGAVLLEEHKAIDRLILVPPGWHELFDLKTVLGSLKTIWKLRRLLRELKFDIVIDVQGLNKSAIAGWISGAPHRIGFRGVDGQQRSEWFNNELVEPKTVHVVDRNLELLRPLGIHNPNVVFRVPLWEADDEKMAYYIAQAGLKKGFAVITPGAGKPSKIWPPERFAAVARHLGQSHSLPVLIVWGTDQERMWAQQIVSAANSTALLAPPTTLQELAALARRARLFIGSDTGPLHLAAAVGCPCVGLYGPLPKERNGPYGPRGLGIQGQSLTGPAKKGRPATNDSMKAISTAEVCAACNVVLGR